MADENKTLTPMSIGTTSFADKAKEYETISTSISDGEESVANAEFTLKNWLNEKNFGKCADGGQLTDLWDKLVITKPPVEPEVDEEKTAALRTEYAEHLKTLVTAKTSLQKKRNKLQDVKNYISFLKEIATIVPRGGDKQQKGGGQNQGQKQE